MPLIALAVVVVVGCGLWGTWCGGHSTVGGADRDILHCGWWWSLLLLAAALGPSIPRSFAAAVDPVFVYCWVPVC